MTELLHKDLSYQIVGAALEVHKVLGPGFLESVYQEALSRELVLRKIAFKPQFPLPVIYKEWRVGFFRPDFVIDGKIIVEIKAAAAFSPVDEAQALNYLAATGLRLTLLLNFGAVSLQIKRMIR